MPENLPLIQEDTQTVTDCEHSLIVGSWVDGEEAVRRCADCGIPMDEDDYPIKDAPDG